MSFLVSAPLAFNFGALEAFFLIMVSVRVASLSEETPWFLYSCKMGFRDFYVDFQEDVYALIKRCNLRHVDALFKRTCLKF